DAAEEQRRARDQNSAEEQNPLDRLGEDLRHQHGRDRNRDPQKGRIEPVHDADADDQHQHDLAVHGHAPEGRGVSPAAYMTMKKATRATTTQNAATGGRRKRGTAAGVTKSMTGSSQSVKRRNQRQM